MNNLQVVIDAGHGGDDSGAVSSGIKEKDLNLQIARYMYEQFQNKGIPVTLIRSTDETISPADRVNRILAAYGNNPNVVVISNHINAAGSGIQGAEGAEVIYALRNNSTLANNILTALGNAGQKVRKTYQRRLPSDTSKDYYFIHRNTGVTQPVIVEYGFIDNSQDLSKIQKNYRSYVDAVVNAVVATSSGSTIPSVPGAGTYTVKSGDSLWSIANKYNISVLKLKSLNNLTSDNLSVGQVLKVTEISSEGVPVVPGIGTYTVKAGDSLWSIASKYNVTVDTLKKLNNLTNENLTVGQTLKIIGAPNTEFPSTPPGPGIKMYTVKAGDSLWSIASNNNTTVNELKSLNNLSSNNLSVGQTLKLPGGTSGGITGTESNTYTVKSGDSLWSIASKYGTTVSALRTLNNLTTDVLKLGQVLRVPSSESDSSGGTAGTGDTYTVKSGDSLWNIANKYATTPSAIKTLNGLTSDNLSIGQLLLIPTKNNSAGGNYTVKSGDSLWSIAKKYNVSVDTIKKLNNLISNSLQIGQILRLP